MRLISFVGLILSALLVISAPAFAKGSYSSGGSRTSLSSSSKSYSSGSKNSSSPKSSSSSKPITATASKPSTGSRPQPAPVTRLIPPAPPRISSRGSSVPPRVTVPRGRSYSRDRSTILRNPRYADPYGRSYYGAWDSPFFYMWLFSVMDGDNSNNALPPSSDDKVDESVLSYLQVIAAEATS